MSVNTTVRTARPNRQLTGRGGSISTTGLWGGHNPFGVPFIIVTH
jgi:hypothetical protein